MIETDIDNKNWAGAAATVQKYRQYWNDKTNKIDNLLSILNEKSQSVVAEALPETVNTTGNEYNPILSSDGNTLYFCGEGRSNNKSGEDIFVSERTADGWSEAQIINEVSTKANDYPQCINASGNTMYIFKNGRLYFSKKAGATWGKPQKMSNNVNSSNWQGDAFLSHDGKALFFAAKRSDMLNMFNDADFDGLVYHGKVDEHQTDAERSTPFTPNALRSLATTTSTSTSLPTDTEVLADSTCTFLPVLATTAGTAGANL